MQLPEKSDRQHVRGSGAQKNGSSDFPLRDLLPLLHQLHGVAMDGVGDLVAQGASELVGILYEIQKRIDNIDVAARCGERVWLSFMDQVKLKRVVVSRLR
jgi:hypothetical protein